MSLRKDKKSNRKTCERVPVNETGLWRCQKARGRRKKGDAERAKLRRANLIRPTRSLPTLTSEEMMPYNHLRSLTRLPVSSNHTLAAVGSIEHYGKVKLIIKLENGKTYLSGESLEQQKEQLTVGCKIFISSIKKRFPICKVIQHGDWVGGLHYDKVPPLPPRKKRTATKVLDVKPVEHKGQKRKLVLTDDGNVYKIKRSKLEDSV